MSVLSSSLQELLVNAIGYEMSNVYTAIPGIIIRVRDMGEMRVDVQPTINVRTQDGKEQQERPPILNVPLEQPVSLQGGLTYPVEAGQPVWLSFSMRGLEKWKRGNAMPEAPADMRRFDVKDCVASPAYPFNMSTNLPSKRTWPHSTDDVVLVHNIGKGSEVEIRLKPNGDCIINSPKMVQVNCQRFEVNASQQVQITTPRMDILKG